MHVVQWLFDVLVLIHTSAVGAMAQQIANMTMNDMLDVRIDNDKIAV